MSSGEPDEPRPLMALPGRPGDDSALFQSCGDRTSSDCPG